MLAEEVLRGMSDLFRRDVRGLPARLGVVPGKAEGTISSGLKVVRPQEQLTTADRRWYAEPGEPSRTRGGDRRRFSTQQHPLYGGIDLPARTRSLGLVPQDGASLGPRQRPAGPASWLQAVAPSRADLVVCGACLLSWSGLADLWARDGRPGVRGPAVARQARHGGQATNDTIDAPHMAGLLRGGLRPQA